MEEEGFPFTMPASDRKVAVKAEWDDSALLQILTDLDRLGQRQQSQKCLKKVNNSS